MTGYQISRKELVMDALNRGVVWVITLGSVITGATSHEPQAFMMLYIFVRSGTRHLSRWLNGSGCCQDGIANVIL